MDLPVLRVPRLEKTPVIDGRIDPEEWRSAAEISSFSGAVDRPAVSVCPTRVRIGWTPEFLWIAFLCTDSAVIAAGNTRDAELHRGDVAEIFLDPVGDAMEYFEIGVAPNGVIADLKFILTAPPVYGLDGSFAPEFCRRHRRRFRSWDMAGLKAAASPFADGKQLVGFQVEVAIPARVVMRRLGKHVLGPGVMRANFCRFDYRPGGGEGVFSSWSQVRFGLPHSMPRRFGFLVLQEEAASAAAR